MADTFGDEMIAEKDNSNRMTDLEAREAASKKKSIGQKIKDFFTPASDEDMQKMASERADVKNATERAIGANPAVNKVDLLKDNATGLKEPINHVTTEQARSGETPEPVKTEGGSVLGDLVDQGKVDDTYLSGAMGGTKDGKALTTEEKREAEGLGPENFNLGDKSNVVDNTGVDSNTAAGASEDGLNPREQKAKDSAMKQWQIAQEVLDEQNPYKSGADYLQALWGKGAKGKAQAVSNVLGNLLGAVGSGVAGKDYTSDWQKFRDEYTAQSQARRAEASQNALNMVNTAAQNDEARMELVNALNQAKANGANLTEKDLAAINAWQTATAPSSALNKAIAALVNKVSQEGLLPAAGNILTGIGGR